MNRLQNVRLYAILDLGYVPPSDAVPVTRALLQSGAGILQLRAKGAAPAAIAELARRLLPLCRQAGIPFVVNDFPEIAAEVGADGLHLGQRDGSLAAARAIVGPDMIIGRSTHSPAQARGALAEGFDYIGFGPLFPTPTKEGRPAIGLADVAAMEREVGAQIPAFCIGGVHPENLDEVIAAGARRVVIVSALLKAADIPATGRAVVARLAGR